MHVLLIEPNINILRSSGGSIHLQELSSELHKHVDLTVVCKCKDASKFSFKVVNTNAARLSILDFFKICKLAKRADIIHSRTDPWELAGPLAAKLRGKPLVSEINTNFMSYEKRGAMRHLLYPLIQLGKLCWIRFVVNLADQVVCVSESIKEAMIRSGISERKLIVNRNGGNPSRFPATNKLELRKKLDLPLKETLILYMVGEISPRYKFEDLPHIDGTYLVLGGVTKNPDYVLKIKELLKGRALFVKSVPYAKSAEYIKASDAAIAFLGESWNKEPFGFCPLKILDCMAAGLTVIASDKPWIREILSEKEGCLISDVKRPIDIDSKRGLLAMNKIRKELTWKHTAERYLELYKSLLQEC